MPTNSLADTVADELHAGFLNLADAPRLDVNLVNDGNGPQHPPARAVIGGFAQEKLFGPGNDLPVLLKGVQVGELAMPVSCIFFGGNDGFQKYAFAGSDFSGQQGTSIGFVPAGGHGHSQCHTRQLFYRYSKSG